MATVQHANFIEYGRRGRQGKPEETEFDPELFGSKRGVPCTRGVKILQKAEFDRIQYSLTADETRRAAHEARETEKQRLKELSRKQVSTWSNTIAGQHKAKLEAKALREEREAEIRRQEDINEDIYKSEQRRQAIEHAKRLTFNKTDRVKHFHGALILTEVLKEREAQLALKRRRQAARNRKAQIDWETEIEELVEANEKERHNAEVRRLLRKDTQKYQLAQVERRRKEEQEMEDENFRFCEQVKCSLAHQLEQEEREEQKQITEKKRLMKDSYFAHLDTKKEFAAKAVEVEKAEQREITIFRHYKDRVNRIRKEKNDAEWAQNDAAIAEAEEKFQKAKMEVDEAQAKKFHQIQVELIKKADRKQEMKNGKTRQDVADILASMHQKIKENDGERKEQIEQERIEGLEKFAEDRRWHEAEAGRAEKRRELAREIQAVHMTQRTAKSDKEQGLREADLTFDRGIITKNVEDEKEFQKYAREVIDEAVEKKRNPYPLRRVADGGAGGGRGPRFDGLGGLCPSYVSSDVAGIEMPNKSLVENDTKKKIVKPLHIAKKRLGFCHW